MWLTSFRLPAWGGGVAFGGGSDGLLSRPPQPAVAPAKTNASRPATLDIAGISMNPAVHALSSFSGGQRRSLTEDFHVFAIRLTIQSPASLVPSAPPISWVVCLSHIAAETAASIRLASRVNPRWHSIIAALRIAPIGLATLFPDRGGAEPCTGSNIEVRPG